MNVGFRVAAPNLRALGIIKLSFLNSSPPIASSPPKISFSNRQAHAKIPRTTQAMQDLQRNAQALI
jgi:hypothetical protein